MSSGASGATRGLHSLRIDRVVTSGTFSLDGGTWDVDNNVWVVGDHTTVGTEAPHLADWIARGH